MKALTTNTDARLLCGPYRSLSLAFVLSFLFPAHSRAQVELRAEKQILAESTHGTTSLKKGPGDRIYALTRLGMPSSAIWVADSAEGSARQMVAGGSEPSDLRVPTDLAVDGEGNAIVADGSIKIFSGSGKLLNWFPFENLDSVATLQDRRILVSSRPSKHLISVLDQQGKLVEEIGEPVKVEGASAGLNAILNMGRIVVDANDNIYFVFRYLLTPTVRKYTADGKMAAEWHPESAGLEQITERAKKRREADADQETSGVTPVLSAAAFDEETNTLWVASGPYLMQLDDAGKTIRNFYLKQPDGVPMQVSALLVDRDLLLASSVLHGVFEFPKPQ